MRSLLEIETGTDSCMAYLMAIAQKAMSQQIVVHAAFDTQVQRAKTKERIFEEECYHNSGWKNMVAQLPGNSS